MMKLGTRNGAEANASTAEVQRIRGERLTDLQALGGWAIWKDPRWLEKVFHNPEQHRDDTHNEFMEHDRMTTDILSPMHGSCACGTCAFDVRTTPAARFICHCTVCQAFTGKPFSDVTVLRAKDVALTNADHISFKKYRPPPNFNRGLCRECGKPVVEVAGFGPFKIIFIPTSNFERQDLLPTAQMHIFYHRRLKDALDDLPKHSGYLRSELAIGRLLMRSV